MTNDDTSRDLAQLVAQIAANDQTSGGAAPSPTVDALALALAAAVRVGERRLHRTIYDDDDPSGATAANDDVLSVDDVAALLQVGRNAVYESVGRGEVPHRRIGKQIRFSRRGIMRWLDSWSSQGAKEGK